MPRKTKEQTELEKEKNKRTTNKKTTTKKSTTKSTGTAKKAATKSASTTKKTTTKKAATKKTTAKRTTSRKKTSAVKNDIVEYYDLPYRYNQTVVKILAQTPSTLFIYWDISDDDRKAFEKQFGEDFFNQTKPVLLVTNDTLGYSFEVEINDFANSWYLHINDSKCDYKVELGRRPITKTEKLNVDYIFISNSNKIETPNDKILFDRNQKVVYFKNIKTGVQTAKNTNEIPHIKNMGYDISENVAINNMNILSNPSSGSIYKY